MMIAWYVPGGRAHIANVWQDLYYYAWRAWIGVRYPNWRESMRVRAIIALIVVAVVLVSATNETFGTIVQIGLLGYWLNRYLRDNQLSKGVMAMLLRALGVMDIFSAYLWAGLIWASLMGGTMVSNGLFAKTRKKVLLIDASYRLAMLVAMVTVFIFLGY